MNVLALFALQAFAAVFVIVDPVGNVGVFLTVTRGMSEDQKRKVALRAPMIATAMLLSFAIGGTGILRLFNISFPAMRIGGGVVLLMVALHILSGKQFGWGNDGSDDSGQPAESNTVVPMAMPMMAGPGAMTTVLVLAEKSSSIVETVIVLLSIVFVCGIAALCYRFSLNLVHRVGKTALATFSCLAGLILAILAIQFMLDGLREACPKLFALN